MKKTTKRILASMLCIGLISSLSMTAFADDKGSVTHDGDGTTWTPGNPEVHGRAEASVISVELTITNEFVINPNATGSGQDVEFVPTDFQVTNTGKIPVKVTFKSLKSKTLANHTKLPVLASDAHTDEEWKAQGIAATKSGIALGIEGTLNSTADAWFAAESGQDAAPGIVVAENLPAFGTENAEQIPIDNVLFSLKAKYGLAWDAAYSFAYDAVFIVEAVA